MKNAQIFDFGTRLPRRNLPINSSRKRGESNFVTAFTKTYISLFAPQGIGGKDFALSGFGIADFVWLAWQHSPPSKDGTALSIEKSKSLESLNTRRKLIAFEMKLTDWRKGLAQAYRYSYFSNLSILVLTPEVGENAANELGLFRKLRVGLWVFDKRNNKIRKLFTPRSCKPRNEKATQKALNSLERFVKFCKFRK
jgi:hypothetical protein